VLTGRRSSSGGRFRGGRSGSGGVPRLRRPVDRPTAARNAAGSPAKGDHRPPAHSPPGPSVRRTFSPAPSPVHRTTLWTVRRQAHPRVRRTLSLVEADGRVASNVLGGGEPKAAGRFEGTKRATPGAAAAALAATRPFAGVAHFPEPTEILRSARPMSRRWVGRSAPTGTTTVPVAAARPSAALGSKSSRRVRARRGREARWRRHAHDLQSPCHPTPVRRRPRQDRQNLHLAQQRSPRRRLPQGAVGCRGKGPHLLPAADRAAARARGIGRRTRGWAPAVRRRRQPGKAGARGGPAGPTAGAEWGPWPEAPPAGRPAPTAGPQAGAEAAGPGDRRRNPHPRTVGPQTVRQTAPGP